MEKLTQFLSWLIRIFRRFVSWWWSVFRKQSTTGKLIFASISLCVVCFACSLPSVVFSPSSTTPTPKPISESSPTSKPTEISILPTDTPVLTETPIPEPTNTPTPKPTSTNTTIPSPTPTSTETSIPTPIGGGTGRIAFVSDREGNDEIYVMNVDGTNLTQLTFNTATDWEPTWSPDGTKIAFASNLDGDKFGYEFEIYIMNADGSNLTRLTTNPGWDTEPTWSPDGTKIAFIREVPDKLGNLRDQIYIMNANGTEQIQLTTREENCSYSNPVWSPSGVEIAFAARCPGAPGSQRYIYTINTDGSGFSQVTSYTGVHHQHPDYSPDGSRIAYGTGHDIVVMNLEVSKEIELTDDYSSYDTNPHWSPDGSIIIFNSGSDIFEDDNEIYMINADGSGLTQITNNDVFDGMPNWQPLE